MGSGLYSRYRGVFGFIFEMANLLKRSSLARAATVLGCWEQSSLDTAVSSKLSIGTAIVNMY
jgi:hypothetical protein